MDWFCVGQAFLLGLWEMVKFLAMVGAVLGIVFLGAGGAEYLDNTLYARHRTAHKILKRVLIVGSTIVFGALMVLLILAIGLEVLSCKV